MPTKKIVRHTSEELKAMWERGEDQTDWKRVRNMRDEDIVFNEDALELTPE